MSMDFKVFTRRAWKKFWKAVENADIILEVLDPRDPMAFRIPMVEKILVERGKKIILVINKADIVPRHVLERWKKVLEDDFPTVYVSTRYRLGTGLLRKTIYKLMKGFNEIRVAVIGYPNVGKSSLINILKGAHSAPTGAKPGLTRSLQMIRRGRLIILDTPGVFPYENADALVYKGAIRVENLDDPVLHAVELIKKIKKIKSNALYATYGIDDDDVMKFLEKLAIRRGKLLKGGVPDIKEAARIVLRDWQLGKLVVWREPDLERDSDEEVDT